MNYLNFYKLQTLISRYKYYIILILFLVYLSGFFNFIGIDLGNVFAADTWPVPENAPSNQEEASKLIKLYNGIIMMASLIINFLTLLVGWFLSPEWTMGDIIEIRPMLHKIWVMMSNIVYILFGIAIIIIAFMNIFGFADGSNYEIKKALPRLIIGVAMVPLTWFIVSSVVSVSNVLAAAVIRLPYETIMTVGDEKMLEQLKKIELPSSIYIDLSKGNNKPIPSCVKQISESGESLGFQPNPEFIKISGAQTPEGKDYCLTIDEFFNGSGVFNILTIYTYMILDMDQLKEIKQDQTNGGTADKYILENTIFDIAKKLLLGVLFILVYAVLIFTLFVVLFVRAVYLWIYIMISPIFGLMFFLGQSNGKVFESLGNFSLSKFISLAMVTVYVSAALAFGFIFLTITNFSKGIEFEKTPSDGIEHLTILDTFNLEIKSGLTPGDTNAVSTLTGMARSTIGYIILNLFSVVMLWIVVMAAFKADDITKGVVAPLIQLSSSVANLAKKSPQMIPMIPGFKESSIANIGAGASRFANTISDSANIAGSQIGGAWGTKAAQSMGLSDGGYLSELKDINRGIEESSNDIKNTNSANLINNKDLANKFDNLFYKVASNPDNNFDLNKIWAQDKGGIAALEKGMQDLGLEDSKITSAKDIIDKLKKLEKDNNVHIFGDALKDLQNAEGVEDFNNTFMQEMKAKSTANINAGYGDGSNNTNSKQINNLSFTNTNGDTSIKFDKGKSISTESGNSEKRYIDKANEFTLMLKNSSGIISSFNILGLNNLDQVGAGSIKWNDLQSDAKSSFKSLVSNLDTEDELNEILPKIDSRLDSDDIFENLKGSIGGSLSSGLTQVNNGITPAETVTYASNESNLRQSSSQNELPNQFDVASLDPNSTNNIEAANDDNINEDNNDIEDESENNEQSNSRVV